MCPECEECAVGDDGAPLFACSTDSYPFNAIPWGGSLLKEDD